MTIYFASLRLCVKLGSQSRRDAKIRKDHICEKHSTTNLFCEMVLVTDSHKFLKVQNFDFALFLWSQISVKTRCFSAFSFQVLNFFTANSQIIICF